MKEPDPMKDWWSDTAFAFRSKVGRHAGRVAMLLLIVMGLEVWLPGAAIFGLGGIFAAMLLYLTLSW